MSDDLIMSSEPGAGEPDMDSIRTGVNLYNVRVTGINEWHPVNIFLRDSSSKIFGGALGELWGGWFHLNFLWVTDEFRGRGYGTKLLLGAENEARGHGARNAFLDTFSFQARPFYE